MDEFPLCGHMVSDEYEQLSSEGESVSPEVSKAKGTPTEATSACSGLGGGGRADMLPAALSAAG